MSSVISERLLKKDIRLVNNTDKDKLYKVKFYNNLEMYLVGKNIEDALNRAKIGVKLKRVNNKYVESKGYKVQNYYVIQGWKELLNQHQIVIKNYRDVYNRDVIELNDFIAYYDLYSQSYYLVNKTTNQSVFLKE